MEHTRNIPGHGTHLEPTVYPFGLPHSTLSTHLMIHAHRSTHYWTLLVWSAGYLFAQPAASLPAQPVAGRCAATCSAPPGRWAACRCVALRCPAGAAVAPCRAGHLQCTAWPLGGPPLHSPLLLCPPVAARPAAALQRQKGQGGEREWEVRDGELEEGEGGGGGEQEGDVYICICIDCYLYIYRDRDMGCGRWRGGIHSIM